MTAFRLLFPLCLALLSACASAPPRADASSPLAQARQLVLVISPDWDSPHAQLQRYERHGNAWQRSGSAHPVMLGRHGSAWGLGLHPLPQPGPQKHEGDGRSPAGVFALPGAFGYAQSDATALPYTGMTASHYCIDVPDSPHYNRIIDANHSGESAIAGSTEPMRMDIHKQGDPRYALGILVDHNPQAITRRGSCIFIHLWRQHGEVTAGCTSMEESDMRALLDWLDPQQQPVFVLLPQSEYQRLHRHWELPALGKLGLQP